MNTTTKAAAQTVHYIVRTGELIKDRPWTAWMQVERISDARVDLIEYVPAELGGWNFRRHEVYENDSWPNMTADQILAFKRQPYCYGAGFSFANEAQIESANHFIAKSAAHAA